MASPLQAADEVRAGVLGRMVRQQGWAALAGEVWGVGVRLEGRPCRSAEGLDVRCESKEGAYVDDDLMAEL